MWWMLFSFLGFVVGGVTLFAILWSYDRHEREEDREERALEEFKKIRKTLDEIRKEMKDL